MCGVRNWLAAIVLGWRRKDTPAGSDRNLVAEIAQRRVGNWLAAIALGRRRKDKPAGSDRNLVAEIAQRRVGNWLAAIAVGRYHKDKSAGSDRNLVAYIALELNPVAEIVLFPKHAALRPELFAFRINFDDRRGCHGEFPHPLSHLNHQPSLVATAPFSSNNSTYS